ncbi:hypothetical protein [Salinimicrobium sp. GXAS 041]|uniref:hypothetical protein n=1 Tax=Salinimicrobium sp. GXAS 041 TaxID=3400806 RepID=UPI003C73A4C2
MKDVNHLNSYNAVPRKGISWRAIFAGVVTILATMLLLNLIGLAIGFGSIEPTEESNPLSGLGTGSLIWWIISCLIALFLGGYVAARVGVSFSNKSGMIQGIMTWALYTFISAWLVTSAVGSIVSGVGNAVGSVISTTGQAIGNIGGGSENQNQEQIQQQRQQQNEGLNISLQQAKEQFYALLEDTQKDSLDPDLLQRQANEMTSEAREAARTSARQPGKIDNQVEQIFNEARNEFQGTFEAVDKQALVNVLTERTDMSEAEAERAVDNYLIQYENLRQQAEEFLQNAKDQANQTAGNIADAIADAALYLAIALILGLIVAAAGGYAGVKSLRHDYANTHYVHEPYDRDGDYDRRDDTHRSHITRPTRTRDRDDDYELR